MKRSSPQAALLIAALLFTPAMAAAGEGHDHGDPAAAPAGESSPRFTAVSDLFELVGILDGQRITLYLDRYADNTPARDARIELEIGGKTFKAEPSKGPQGGDEYTVVLAAAPAPGVLPVTATVTSGSDADLLAGELDIHDEHAHADEAAHTPGWRRTAAWAVGGLAALALLGWAVRRSKGTRSVRAGGAA
jgi:hypothetical protein